MRTTLLFGEQVSGEGFLCVIFDGLWDAQFITYLYDLKMTDTIVFDYWI